MYLGQKNFLLEKSIACIHLNMRKLSGLIINIPILSILNLALLLRLWGIAFGLPQAQIGDEWALVYATFYTGANTLKPLRYQYGALIPYILLLEYGAYYIFGFLSGSFSSPNDLFAKFVHDPSELILLGRVTMAIVGVLTVWLTYFIGKTFYTKHIGLMAAFFLSIAFLAVKESHYLKEGNLSTFFSLGCYYFILKIVQKAKPRDYVAAGITLGLGIGAKFESLLMLPIFFLGHLLVNRRIEIKKLAYFMVGFISFTLLTFPMLLIDLNAYLALFQREFTLTMTRYPLHLLGKPIWWWFLNVHLPQGLGIPLFVVSILGFIISFIKSILNKNYLFLPLLPVVFLATIDFWQQFHFARYAILTLPFYMLGAAVFIDWIAAYIKNRQLRYFFVGLVVITLSWVSINRVVKFNTLILQPDTRYSSKEWIEANIPSGSSILVETALKPEYAANLNVPLTLDEQSINDRIQTAHAYGYPATYLNALRQVNKNTIGYKIIPTQRVNLVRDLMSDISTPINDASYWAEKKVEYLVLSSWASLPDVNREFKKSILDNYELIKEFSPHPEFSDDPHFVQMDYQILDKINIFDSQLLFGPNIMIYRLKKNSSTPFSD